jgi:hypothetical protein
LGWHAGILSYAMLSFTLRFSADEQAVPVDPRAVKQFLAECVKMDPDTAKGGALGGAPKIEKQTYRPSPSPDGSTFFSSLALRCSPRPITVKASRSI